MKLTGGDGSALELLIDRYQFPGHGRGGGRDGDANWLMVTGRVWRVDAESWSFSQPCLTTWEARGLGHWLEQAGVNPVDRLEFTEPNLAFALDRSGDDRPTVQVWLASESRPPSTASRSPGAGDVRLSLRMTSNALRAAALTWADELMSYPVR